MNKNLNDKVSIVTITNAKGKTTRHMVGCRHIKAAANKGQQVSAPVEFRVGDLLDAQDNGWFAVKADEVRDMADCAWTALPGEYAVEAPVAPVLTGRAAATARIRARGAAVEAARRV